MGFDDVPPSMDPVHNPFMRGFIGTEGLRQLPRLDSGA